MGKAVAAAAADYELRGNKKAAAADSALEGAARAIEYVRAGKKKEEVLQRVQDALALDAARQMVAEEKEERLEELPARPPKRVAVKEMAPWPMELQSPWGSTLALLYRNCAEQQAYAVHNAHPQALPPTLERDGTVSLARLYRVVSSRRVLPTARLWMDCHGTGLRVGAANAEAGGAVDGFDQPATTRGEVDHAGSGRVSLSRIGGRVTWAASAARGASGSGERAGRDGSSRQPSLQKHRISAQANIVDLPRLSLDLRRDVVDELAARSSSRISSRRLRSTRRSSARHSSGQLALSPQPEDSMGPNSAQLGGSASLRLASTTFAAHEEQGGEKKEGSGSSGASATDQGVDNIARELPAAETGRLSTSHRQILPQTSSGHRFMRQRVGIDSEGEGQDDGSSSSNSSTVASSSSGSGSAGASSD